MIEVNDEDVKELLSWVINLKIEGISVPLKVDLILCKMGECLK